MTVGRRTARLAMAVAFLAAGVAGAAVACTSTPTPEDRFEPISKGPRQTTTTDDDASEDTSSRSPDDDIGPPDVVEPAEDAGPDPTADAGACVGKTDGFNWNPADKQARCCNQMPMRLTSDGNCGACGAKCYPGFHCKEVPTSKGHYTCTCDFYNAHCNTSYGPSGTTCYDGYCNCQGSCKGGATCFQPSFTNYCAYP